MAHQDEDLIRRWQAGDARAFEDLVRCWQDPVGRFLARLVGRSDLVSDLSQEVFLRLYQAGPRYRERGTFSSWLYRVALNVARDAGRRRRLAPEALRNHDPPTNGVAVDQHCEQQELADTVAQALAELPEPLREVLVLRHYEQMNFEEIARLLHTPASTLKSRFAAALQRLRLRLAPLDWHYKEKT
jgi:RNA polymerase sigma-70 factor (ECF subfamily)